MGNNIATYGLAGFPLGHSFSKKYFTEKFEREHITASYLNFEVAQIDNIYQIIKEYPHLQGFNVTIPHKQNILPLLNALSEEAQKIGAVNCVKIKRCNEDIFLTGYNTDAAGFQKSLREFIPEHLSKALILGNGGAAKAVRFVLNKLGMKTLTISRKPDNEDEAGYPELAKIIRDFPLIVNTTPLGTWPDTDSCPEIPYHLLTSAHYLFDLVYNPEVTEFMKRGAMRGAHTQNGMQMLIGQAEEAWRIWNTPDNTKFLK